MSEPISDNDLLREMIRGKIETLEPVTLDDSKRNYDKGYDALFGKPENEGDQE